jgi:hypothetical protein
MVLGHGRSDRDGSAMVLFTGPTEPRNDYSLSLEIDRIPPDLAQSQAVVKVGLVSDYYLFFFVSEASSRAVAFGSVIVCVSLSSLVARH